MRSKRSWLCALLFGFSAVGTALCSSPATEEVLSADTRLTTPRGNTLVAPGGWSLRRADAMLILTAPEKDSHIAVADVDADDADRAATAAWTLYDAASKPSLAAGAERPARNGWEQIRHFKDEHAPTGRARFAQALQHDARWTVVIYDMSDAVADKRDAQLTLIFGGLAAKGYVRESFAGRRAHTLDGKRLASLKQFVERARRAFDVPGVAIGIVQYDKVVLSEGFGVRALGKADKVDADTLFLIASNTKPLTTLMLAKLVDAGRFEWDTPVTAVMPRFALGDAATTRQMRMKHLVCACTGLPRQDFEWIFESEQLTPDGVLATVATFEPTSEFGALYQYSNLLAGTAGFVGGHALHPRKELGAAYDAAMQELVFDPLEMRSTTFDFTRAQRENHADAHSQAFDGTTRRVDMALNLTGIASRPDGGAWSNVHDLLSYVRMELANGLLPDGTRYIAAEPLLARRVSQVSRGDALGYGMGLKLDESSGVMMIHHGGTAFGAVSDVLWLPDHEVGLVILTNADSGSGVRNLVRRRLLELLFDGNSEAEPQLAMLAKRQSDELDAERANWTAPASANAAKQLAARYHNESLGDIVVARTDGRTWFDFGGWRSEVASAHQDNRTTRFMTIAPGALGYEFEVANSEETQTLVLRDAQQAYEFVAVRESGRSRAP